MGYVILIDSKSERARGVLTALMFPCSKSTFLPLPKLQKRTDDGRAGGDGERHKRRKGLEGNDIRRRRIGKAYSIGYLSDCIEM